MRRDSWSRNKKTDAGWKLIGVIGGCEITEHAEEEEWTGEKLRPVYLCLALSTVSWNVSQTVPSTSCLLLFCLVL